ncbi:MAG: MFS transporter [Actinobacteria bacterium]|nr:MFS transporter [Actinomycetota bacterium]
MFAVRWMGQFTDGLFQSALASFVLFSPERQPSAQTAALAFSVVLLPYSLIGPFVGTLLDRFSRQRIIFGSNLFRAVTLIFIAALIRNGLTGVQLTIFILVAFGVNRLILAGLSAGLPLLVDKKQLISYNAVAVTGGTVFVVIGGGVGIGFRHLLDSQINADNADGYLIVLAAACYTIASLLALLMPKSAIGPLENEIKKVSFIDGYREMRDGFKMLRNNRDCFLGISATGIQRGGSTAITLMALLLMRNTFNDPANPEAGLVGFAFAITLSGVGITIGAIIAPFGVAKYGRHKWIRSMLIACSVFPFALALSQTEIVLIVVIFFVGLFGQSLKVTNDALVQSRIIDEYRGRVFAVYDVMINGGIVSGAVIAALLLPANGAGALLPFMVGLIYLLMALVILSVRNFHADRHATN